MSILSSIPQNLQDLKVVVLGARRSGCGAALLAAAKGARVLLSDVAQVEIAPDWRAQLEQARVEIELGVHSERVFEADLVVLSPGIPTNAPIVRELSEKLIPVIAEVELAYWFCPTPNIIAVTGSNGKTTTTTLLYEMFKESAYRPFCGGNIGVAFSNLILEYQALRPENPLFILELSSFQLERIVHFRPKVAVILNLTPDHMDRYEHSMDLYLQAKLRITMNQQADDWYVYNDDDPLLQAHLPTNCRVIPAGLHSGSSKPISVRMEAIYDQDGNQIIPLRELGLIGEHNLYNILATLNAARLFGLSNERFSQVLRTFRGVEHRLEYVATIDGVDFYNDSKATNVDSVIYALKSFSRPVVIILGGKDKDSDFRQLIPQLRAHAKAAILVGKAAPKLREALTDVLPLYDAGYSLEKALELAVSVAQPGEVVLLSPACASFDMFNDFEHRGRVFKELVHKHRLEREAK
jgi:UDP-N-acetylmuramoylalanine--D-glutamate ligase